MVSSGEIIHSPSRYLSNSDPILVVQGLNAFYGPFQAISEVNFSLYPGKTLALVGESGSGKSTIALSLVGALEGEVTGSFFFKNKLVKNPEELRGNRVAMIFQDPSSALNPVFTIGWQLMEAIGLWLNLDEEAGFNRAIQALEEVHLPDPFSIFKKYPHELSGGQRQRAMIAMAIAIDPEVLIADEPTTALDVTVQVEILQLLQSLQKQRNMAILLITHDMGVVSMMANDVAVLYAGQTVETGKAKNVLKKPFHPYTEALIEASFLEATKEGRLTPIQGNVPGLGDEPSGCRFHPRCPYVFQACQENPVPCFKVDHQEVRCLLYQDVDKNRVKQKGLHKEILPFYQPQVEAVPILKVNNLSKRFPLYEGTFRKVSGWVNAVSEVSFDVYKNEVVGIVGESGSGKTTLGKIIAGLISPSSGSFEINRPPQMIFQDPGAAMNPRHTVEESLLEPLIYHKLTPTEEEAKALVIDLLEKLGFDQTILNRYPHAFSLGQKQRLAIARSLLLNPEIIICDEPVSALDVSIQAQILNLFLDLKKDFNTSLLFISHDLAVVKFIASRVIVMEKGMIVEQGIVKDIFENPSHPYTKRLINGCSLLGNAVN